MFFCYKDFGMYEQLDLMMVSLASIFVLSFFVVSEMT